MNRSTAAASVLGLCIAGGVGGYLAGQQAPQEFNASGPATTSAVAPTAVATPRATSSVSAQSDAAPPGAGVAGSSTAATDAASPGVVAPPPAEVTDTNPGSSPRGAPDGTRTGAPAAPNKGDRPQQAPGTTKRSSGGSSSDRPSGRLQTEATPRPSQKRTAAPNPPGDAQATWNSLSQAERDSLIARYQAMSPSEKKAARAAVCAQYGVGC